MDTPPAQPVPQVRRGRVKGCASVSGNMGENARAAASQPAPDTKQALNAEEQQQPCQSLEAQ